MTHHPTAAIELIDLSFEFTPKRPSFSLSIESLIVAPGQRVALVGASGTGKSTLLGLVCGVLRPQSGQVRVMNQRLESMSNRKRDKFRAENLGIIFQQFNLLPYLSVIDNVVLALEFSKKRKLSTFDKQDKAKRLLAALDIDVGKLGKKRVSDLSVGQQQRVAAARAFVGEPPLIIADEPTSALDEGRQSEFLDLLFKQADETGATLLLVTHDSRVARHFDRVLDLQDVCQIGKQEKAL